MKTKLLQLLIAVCMLGACKSNKTTAETNTASQNSGDTTIVQVSTEGIEYDTYRNERYDFFISYPLELIPQGESKNGDGQKFISVDGKNQMWAHRVVKLNKQNDLLSFEDAFAQDLEGKNVSEKALHSNYYMITGTQGNKLFYLHTILAYGRYYTIWFEYEQEYTERFERIIGDVLQSLSIGTGGDDMDYSFVDKFLIFIADFFSRCYGENNFNDLLRSNSPLLSEYLDPQMDIGRYYNPGTVTYLYSRADNFGFNDNDDFSTQEPDMLGGELNFYPMELDYRCDLLLEDAEFGLYYKQVDKVPDNMNSETLEVIPVELPYSDAIIMCVHVIDGKENLRTFYFVYTNNLGWKLAFVDDSSCFSS